MLRICSVIDNAFLLEHFDYHRINSGEKVPDRIRASTAKALASRKFPEIFMQSNCMQTSENMDLSKIPSGFPYQDIIEGKNYFSTYSSILNCFTSLLLDWLYR